jgi:hypothetical protein
MDPSNENEDKKVVDKSSKIVLESDKRKYFIKTFVQIETKLI